MQSPALGQCRIPDCNIDAPEGTGIGAQGIGEPGSRRIFVGTMFGTSGLADPVMVSSKRSASVSVSTRSR